MSRTINSIPYVVPSEMETFIENNLNPSVINLVFKKNSKELLLDVVIDPKNLDFNYEIKKGTIIQRITKPGVLTFEREYKNVTYKDTIYTSTQDGIYNTYIYSCDGIEVNKIVEEKEDNK